MSNNMKSKLYPDTTKETHPGESLFGCIPKTTRQSRGSLEAIADEEKIDEQIWTEKGSFREGAVTVGD